jgi:hypothetical protein
MASGGAGSGQVVLRGRFKPGSRVQLVEVAGEHVLRAQGGREVAEGVVGDDGCVAFSSGVKVGGRYFVVGRVDGFPLEVRCRGNRAGEESTALAQEPVRSDRTRLANGAWSDEAPEAEAAPGAQVAPGPAQHQVPSGQVQRSATALGVGTPMDPEETLPYARPDPAWGCGQGEAGADASQVKGARGEPVKAAAEPVKPSERVRRRRRGSVLPARRRSQEAAAKSSSSSGSKGSGRRPANTTKKEG